MCHPIIYSSMVCSFRLDAEFFGKYLASRLHSYHWIFWAELTGFLCLLRQEYHVQDVLMLTNQMVIIAGQCLLQFIRYCTKSAQSYFHMGLQVGEHFLIIEFSNPDYSVRRCHLLFSYVSFELHAMPAVYINICT